MRGQRVSLKIEGGVRGSPVGDYLKSTSWWNGAGNGSNSSGFNGLPGGYCHFGGFSDDGGHGNWWSASESDSNSWKRTLDASNDNVERINDNRYYGFSARCVQD